GLETTPVTSVGDTVEMTDTGETTLDIEIIHAIAPKAHLIAYTSRSPYDEIAQMVSQIVTDDKAQIISISLGGCELAAQFHNADALSAFDAAFQQAAAQGMSVLVSSGDD